MGVWWSKVMVVGACALAAAGCNRPQEPQAGDAPAKPTVALVLKTLNSPFFIAMQQGAQAEADRLGATLVVQAAGAAELLPRLYPMPRPTAVEPIGDEPV